MATPPAKKKKKKTLWSNLDSGGATGGGHSPSKYFLAPKFKFVPPKKIIIISNVLKLAQMTISA